MDTASAAVGGRLCSPTLAQLWAASVVKSTDVSHRLETCATASVSSRARWPAHRFGVLLGSREELRGRPARVRRPAVGSPKIRRARELARLYRGVRGHWRAHKRGCWWVLRDGVCARVAVLTWERGGFGEIYFWNRVLGMRSRTVFVRAREVGRREEKTPRVEDSHGGTRHLIQSRLGLSLRFRLQQFNIFSRM